MSGTETILAWRIETGEFRGAPLAGVKMAAVLAAPTSLSMGFPPRRSVLFIDAPAEAQRAAAEALARENYRALLGEVLKVRAVPIRFERTAGKAAVGIGDFLEVRLEEAEIPANQEGRVRWYEPFVRLSETVLANGMVHAYRGPEFGRQWSWTNNGATGYFGRFVLKL